MGFLKALGPDGISVLFYHKFWDSASNDLIMLA
jgi:hypothetical protein